MANLVATETARGCATHGSEEATVTLLRATRCVIALPLLTILRVARAALLAHFAILPRAIRCTAISLATLLLLLVMVLVALSMASALVLLTVSALLRLLLAVTLLAVTLLAVTLLAVTLLAVALLAVALIIVRTGHDRVGKGCGK